MNSNAFRYMVAAAAVIVLAFVGIRFLPGLGSFGGPLAPTPTPQPTASPRPMSNGALTPGTYLVQTGRFTRKDFTITVPEGWSFDRTNENYVSKGDVFEGNGVTFASWIVSHVYTDSCQWEGTLREVGSAAELASALAEQTGHDTSGPIDVTLGGYPAKRLDFSVASDFDVSTCQQAFIRLWPDAGPNENYGLPISPGQNTTVYVVDLGTAEMLMVAIRAEGSSAADVTELEQVMASIRIER